MFDYNAGQESVSASLTTKSENIDVNNIGARLAKLVEAFNDARARLESVADQLFGNEPSSDVADVSSDVSTIADLIQRLEVVERALRRQLNRF